MSLSRLRTLKCNSDVDAVAFSPDGKCVVTGGSCCAKIWDITNGALLYTFDTSSPVSCVAFCPSGDLVAAGMKNDIIKIWKVSAGVCLCTLNGHTLNVHSVAFSPHDGGRTLASASYDETARIWDATTGVCIRVLSGHSSVVYSIAYSPYGSRLVTGSDDKTCKVWDADTGACITTFDVGSCRSVAFSPNGRVIAALTDKDVWLLNASTRTVIHKLCESIYINVSLTFASNWCLLITGWEDYYPCYFSFVKFWDIHTGTCLTTQIEYGCNKGSIAVSPCSAVLATTFNTNRITILDISSVGSKVIVLTLVLAGRRRRLPHIPQELWELVLDEF